MHIGKDSGNIHLQGVDIMDKLNERIKKMRLSKGLTLLEVADHLKVREATAQRYESGKIKNIKQKTIIILSELFNCSPSYLMGWSEKIVEYKNVFGKKIISLRVEKKLSQQDLAKATGLLRETISLHESNRKIPDISTVQILSDYFNVSFNYLMGDTVFKNDIEEVHSISIYTLRQFQTERRYKKIDEYRNIFKANIKQKCNNNLSEDLVRYSFLLLEKFIKGTYLTDLEALELSQMLYSKIDWETYLNEKVRVTATDLENEQITTYYNLDEIKKLTIDINYSLFFSKTNNKEPNKITTDYSSLNSNDEQRFLNIYIKAKKSNNTKIMNMLEVVEALLEAEENND